MDRHISIILYYYSFLFFILIWIFDFYFLLMNGKYVIYVLDAFSSRKPREIPQNPVWDGTIPT